MLIVTNCPVKEYLGSGLVIKIFSERLLNEFSIDIYTPENFKGVKFLKNRGRFYQNSWDIFLIVKKAFNQKRYDGVIFFGGESWVAAIYLKIIKSKVKLIHHSNGIEPFYAKQEAKYSTSNKLGYNMIAFFSWFSFITMDGIIVHNYQDKLWIQKRNKLSKPNILSVPIPLSEEFLGREKIKIKSRDKNIGFIGSWIKRKGIVILIEVVEKLLEENPDWSFIIIGQSEEFNKEVFFKKEIVSRITVFPLITEKERIIEILQNIRIMFLPSLNESFGLVFTESMACGCVLVASSTGFAQSLNDEACINSENSLESYYTQIKNLIADEELCQNFSDKGYMVSQTLNKTDIMLEYLEFVKNIIN